METKKIKAEQLYIKDDGSLGVEPIEDSDTLTIKAVDYKDLDKVDLIRLCNEKDAAIKSYETERNNHQDQHNKEIEDMNSYYVARINELKSLIKYYERKFKLIINLINIEKGEDNDDSIQRTTKGQA